ncbi:MAG TPA: winged helix DNA-binding domain-containing protein [Polyangiaceae bacterium]|nr:winged helix DNA-binding domain-containing protein [Polyangiaceae bacterium]
MKDEEIARLRLRRQHLTGVPLATPEAVVGWLGAAQAQEFVVAKWSLARRCSGRVTSADLDRALAEGRILRTHALRATWHFVLPDDLRWLSMLIGPRVRARMVNYYRKSGLTDAVFARSQAVLREALAGGRQLLRTEVAAALARGRVATDGLKLRFLLLQAELDLVVCSGALRGRQQTFALVDDRVPAAPPIPEDEALAELARRYFSSHGPATLNDFIWWSSLTAARARRGLELSQENGLRRLEAGGRTYWMSEAPARRATRGTPVHLLQAFDEYVIGYTESRDVLAVVRGLDARSGAPRNSNPLTRDGQVIGFWRSVIHPDEALVDVHLARPLDAAARSALEDEIERYGRFLQLPVRLNEAP